MIVDLPYRIVYAPIKAAFNQHQRRLLMFLIVLIALFSMALCIFSIYLATIFYEANHSESIITWILLAMVGIFLMITCIAGLRGSHFVNLELLLSFFWGVMVFIAPLLLGIISCFDLYSYIRLVFIHNWHTPAYSNLRNIFCSPASSADFQCAAPYEGGFEFETVDQWCISNFNSTSCATIRNKAITRAVRVWVSTFFLDSLSLTF
jgi:hypothetical protein